MRKYHTPIGNNFHDEIPDHFATHLLYPMPPFNEITNFKAFCFAEERKKQRVASLKFAKWQIAKVHIHTPWTYRIADVLYIYRCPAVFRGPWIHILPRFTVLWRAATFDPLCRIPTWIGVWCGRPAAGYGCFWLFDAFRLSRMTL